MGIYKAQPPSSIETLCLAGRHFYENVSQMYVAEGEGSKHIIFLKYTDISEIVVRFHDYSCLETFNGRVDFHDYS